MLAPAEDAAYVWWDALADACAEWASILDPVAHERLAAYRGADDRNRFLLGCALVRLAWARSWVCRRRPCHSTGTARTVVARTARFAQTLRHAGSHRVRGARPEPAAAPIHSRGETGLPPEARPW